MTRRLTSEQLGAAGEALFQTLCERAQLICSKSQRDMAGWDFVVDFPMEGSGAGRALDQRSVLSCHVQLKSTGGEGRAGRVSARLSAVEQLAKQAGPSLLVVFRLRPDGEGLAGYLIHLLDAELAKLLERLRKAEADGRFDINHATISFDYQKVGLRFALTPDGLRGAIEEVCGDDGGAYRSEKQRQLAETGYDDAPIEAEALVWIEGSKQLSRIMYGLEPLRPESLQAYDRRFGVRIPYRGRLFDELEELTITPATGGRCAILFRAGPFSKAAAFEADILFAPPIGNEPWMVLRHPDFVLGFTDAGLNFETLGVIDEVERPLEDWAMLMRALSLLQGGDCSVTVRDEAARFPDLILAVNTGLRGPYLRQLPQIERLLAGWQDLVGLVGLSSVMPFPLQALFDAVKVSVAVDLLLHRRPRGRFEFDDLGMMPASDHVEALFFDTCELADVALSYSVKVRLEPVDGQPGRYHSTGFDRLDIRPAVADLNQYGEDQAGAAGLSVLINPANITYTPVPLIEGA